MKKTIGKLHYKLGNAIRYFKIGYNTHDWDYEYGLQEFLNKLERLAQAMQNENPKDTHINKIHEAVSRIRAALKDDYMSEWDKFQNKYPKYTLEYSYKPPKTLEEEKIHKIRQRYYGFLLKKADAQRDIDLQKGFDIIAKNICQWWV